MPLPDESRLIRRIRKKRDRRAANELVGFYYREIYAFIYRQTLRRELSMELTQEIFIAALQSLPSFDEKRGGFRTWLYRIASHKLTDYYRSRTHQQELITVRIEPENGGHADFDYELFERREIAGQALALLSSIEEAAQQVVRLKIFSEYTFAEIASLLDIPESTAKKKYYSALNFLRKELTPNEN